MPYEPDQSPSNLIQLLKIGIGCCKKVVPKPLRQRIAEYFNSLRTARSPDRAILTEKIFPALSQTSALAPGAAVLWIGCRRYTMTYYALLECNGAQCWTLDIDPTVSRWGREGRHQVGDILDLAKLFSDMRFEAILCNGVFGFGIDTVVQQRRASEAMAGVLKPGGWLLLGWNTDRLLDPLQTGVMMPWFEPAHLPGFGEHHPVAGCTHVYDLFRRTSTG